MRLQSALDFLIEYGVAFTIITLALALIGIYFTRSPLNQYNAPQCNILATYMDCLSSHIFTQGSKILIYIQGSNLLSTSILMPLGSIEVSYNNALYAGNCTPQFVLPGSYFSCYVLIQSSAPIFKQNLQYTFYINYISCNGLYPGTCTSSYLRSSGSAVSAVSNSIPNIYKVRFKVNGGNGYALLDNSSLVNGSILYIIQGSYPLVAEPYYGSRFASWSSNVSGELLANTRATTISIDSNTNLTLELD
ncbi:MAG: hypothetical protein ARM1_0446 [Candidatus Micrarchaeota archaeon]|nr:MAG: hypothetical protein ARM1_0446 [Candidatus Micrarchaeota archaeon]